MTDIMEVSRVIQGEGRFAGVPHLLIRVSGCPLRCKFGESRCDTAYASWEAEPGNISLEHVKAEIKDCLEAGINHIMITGGEPTAHIITESIVESCGGAVVTMETAGFMYRKYMDKVGLLSLSPKLSNSVPYGTKHKYSHQKNRTRYDQMAMMIASARSFQIKYVISDSRDVEEAKTVNGVIAAELLKISQSHGEDYNLRYRAALLAKDLRQNTYFMPEGELNEHLSHKRQWLMETCINEGINYTDRLHIIAYGDKRNV